jgi:hypothetical protein
MILFNEEIVKLLNEYFSKEAQFIESVQLAFHGFAIQFTDYNIQCSERVFAFIDDISYEREDAPNSGPWCALGRQYGKSAKLKSPSLLSITFESGDSIDIETVESRYESVIFNFQPQGNSLVMEIF